MKAPPHARRGVSVVALCVALTGLAGCASLPQVAPAVGRTSSAETPRVVGTRGPLSAIEVDRLIARLTPGPDDDALLNRHLAIEQAVAETPLLTGQAVHLLRDGPETFRATFAAIRSARHDINLEYFIF